MLKKIVYFLLACEEKPTVLFLKKHKFSFPENKGLPTGFIQKSKRAFEKNKQEVFKEENIFFSWKIFCKRSSYEEVLSVLLSGVLKYPPEKICWLLKVKPEDLSYRLAEGLLILGDELSRTQSGEFFREGQPGKKVNWQNLNPEEKKLKTLQYCNWLSERPFPDSLEKMSFLRKSLKVRYCLFVCLLLFGLGVWLISFLFSPPSSVILYQSP